LLSGASDIENFDRGLICKSIFKEYQRNAALLFKKDVSYYFYVDLCGNAILHFEMCFLQFRSKLEMIMYVYLAHYVCVSTKKCPIFKKKLEKCSLQIRMIHIFLYDIFVAN
jgi:hypothetical protein